jgi:hypothetical protein
MATKFVFQIVAGGGSHHHSDGKEYTAGQNIETSEDLAERFPGKFILVDKARVAPETPALDLVAEQDKADQQPAKAVAASTRKSAATIITPPKGVKLVAKAVGGFKFNVIREDSGEVIAAKVTKRTANDLVRGETVEV